MFAPQSEDVVFPPDHLTGDEHHRYCKETNEEEEGMSLLHHIQPLLVSEILETGKETVKYESASQNVGAFIFC